VKRSSLIRIAGGEQDLELGPDALRFDGKLRPIPAGITTSEKRTSMPAVRRQYSRLCVPLGPRNGGHRDAAQPRAIAREGLIACNSNLRWSILC
jgi:hypothetical protein